MPAKLWNNTVGRVRQQAKCWKKSSKLEQNLTVFAF